MGLVDQLLNSRQIRDAPNILILHVTSFPFALQTQYTRISPYNEIHWPSAFSNVRQKPEAFMKRTLAMCTSDSNSNCNTMCFCVVGCGPVSREDTVFWCVRALRVDPFREQLASHAL